MDQQTNKDTIRRVREEALSTGRLDRLDGLYAADYRYHGGETFGELEGRDAFALVAGGFRQAIDGLSERVVDQIGLERLVGIRRLRRCGQGRRYCRIILRGLRGAMRIVAGRCRPWLLARLKLGWRVMRFG